MAKEWDKQKPSKKHLLIKDNNTTTKTHKPKYRIFKAKIRNIHQAKNNKARVPTNITKVGSVTSMFIVIAQRRE